MTNRLKGLSLLSLFILLAFSLLGCGTTSKDQSWEKIKDSGKLVVGLCAAYPPFESRNEVTGELEGFDIDLAKALAKELNLDVEIKDAEWQALLGGLNKGDFDVLITCMSKKEAAVENVNMSDVYYVLNDVIVVRSDEKTINHAEDLKGKVVGVQLGSGSEQIVDKMEGLKEIKRYNYNPEAFIDLKNGRIDAVVVGYAYAVNQLKQEEGFRILDEQLEPSEIVMVMRYGEDSLTEKLNEALKNIKANGEYDRALEKWLTVS
jgi:polar amino acid transport system substrate-binding protein